MDCHGVLWSRISSGHLLWLVIKKLYKFKETAWPCGVGCLSCNSEVLHVGLSHPTCH